MPFDYVVKAGDTLGSIALRHGQPSPGALYHHPLNADFRRKRPDMNKIYVGDVVVIPLAADPPLPAKPRPCERILPAPFIIGQANTWWCWAAGYDSFSMISMRPHKSQAELLAEFPPNTPPYTDGNGGLLKPGWDLLKLRFMLTSRIFSVKNSAPDRPADLDPKFLRALLDQKGHLLVVWNLRPGVAHTNVVYGVSFCDAVHKIMVMDPQGGGKLETRPLSTYTGSDYLEFIWVDFDTPSMTE